MDLLQYAGLQAVASSNLNPQTGDPNQGILWIVVGALVVSAILIIVLLVLSRKKKDKKK